jgi:hypothetical protein
MSLPPLLLLLSALQASFSAEPSAHQDLRTSVDADGNVHPARPFELERRVRRGMLPLRGRRADRRYRSDQEAPDPGASAPDWAEVLADAKRAYNLREHERATELFESIVSAATLQDTVPFEIEASALVYLGEMYFLKEERAQADAMFRSVLERDLDYEVSQLDHPIEVYGAFEYLRRTIERERAVVVPVKARPYPFWGVLPLGIPQFGQDKPVRGTLYLLLQTGLIAANATAWGLIFDLKDDIPDQVNSGEVDPSVQRARLLRDGLAYPTAGAAYAVWAISVADGAISWKRNQRPVAGATLLPGRDGGVVVAVSGQF